MAKKKASKKKESPEVINDSPEELLEDVLEEQAAEVEKPKPQAPKQDSNLRKFDKFK